MHYNTIRNEGYSTGMVAFFPLFPLIWKLLHAGPILISVINGFLYIVSFAWLTSTFNFSNKRMILYASIPCLMFMFLPMSEAVFFCASVMMLTGLKKNNLLLTAAGIFLCGLARPVATIFVPALLILVMHDRSKENIHRTAWMIAAVVVSTLAVFIIQYFQTGDMLAFFHVQKAWGNYVRLPSFPLNSWAGGFIVRLDAIAFFSGLGALFILLWRSRKKESDELAGSTELFSFAYLGFLLMVVLFTRGGILNSLNRYLFCSAFFIVALEQMLNHKKISIKNAMGLFAGSSVCWLLFASYVHIQTVLKFELLSVYLLLLFFVTSENRILKQTGYFSVLAVNIIFMMIFYHRFLTGAWVG